MTKVTRKAIDTNFGYAVSKILASRSMSQGVLARLTKKNASYTNHVMTGYRKPSPEYVDLVANTLNLDAKTRARLHRDAALDNGFKFDLS